MRFNLIKSILPSLVAGATLAPSGAAAQNWITFDGGSAPYQNEPVLKWLDDTCRPDNFGDVVIFWTQVGPNAQPDVHVFCKPGGGGLVTGGSLVVTGDWDVDEQTYAPRSITEVIPFLAGHRVLAWDARWIQDRPVGLFTARFYVSAFRKPQLPSNPRNAGTWLPYWGHPHGPSLENGAGDQHSQSWDDLVSWINNTCKPDDMGDISFFFGQYGPALRPGTINAFCKPGSGKLPEVKYGVMTYLPGAFSKTVFIDSVLAGRRVVVALHFTGAQRSFIQYLYVADH